MLNRRYLGWLIAGAYVAPHGPYSRPETEAALAPQPNRHAPVIAASSAAATALATDTTDGAPRC